MSPEPPSTPLAGGRLVEVDGEVTHVVTGGAGPVVVLESGLGGGTVDWGLVAEEVEGFAHVVRRDRPGLGASAPRRRHPATALQAAVELRALFAELALTPPYVLVGHSLGGLHVRIFASLFPEDVRGLVLVDPSHEDADEEVPKLALALRAQSALARTLVRLGPPGRATLGAIYRASLSSECVEPKSEGVARVLAEAFAATRRPDVQRAIAAEFAGLARSFEQMREVRTQAPLPPVPLVVISQGRVPRSRLMRGLLGHWHRLHAGLAASVPGGRHLVAEHSGHLVPLEQPGLVATAIRDVLAASAAS